jgi:hypothetical protein
MQWLVAASVGVAGGATIEAIDVFKAIRWHHTMPWNVPPDTRTPPQPTLHTRPGEEHLPAPGPWAYCLAGILRLFVSAAPPAAIAASYPHTMNPLIAYTVGLGALSVVQQLTALAPLIVKSAGHAALTGMTQHQPPHPLQQTDPSEPALLSGQNNHGPHHEPRPPVPVSPSPASTGREGD